MKARRIFLFLALTVCFFSGVSGQELYVSNSEDWRDVYSVLQFARLNDADATFLSDAAGGLNLLGNLNKNVSLNILSSRDSSWIPRYGSIFKKRGFEHVRETFFDEASLDLVKDLPSVKKFIIVGNSNGADSIAVAPYAALTGSWVFFADRKNVDKIVDFISLRNAEEILIYGDVDKEVVKRFEQFNPGFINKGDKFSNNLEIVRKYLGAKPSNKVFLTNGEFIEKDLVSGEAPIIFVGKETVPDAVTDFIFAAGFDRGVLVGSNLVDVALHIENKTGLDVIVKFERNSRDPHGSIASVEDLSLFYIPSSIFDVDIDSVKYNLATSQIEIIYRSLSSSPVFLQSNLVYGGVRVFSEPIFISPYDFRTDYLDAPNFMENSEVSVLARYGETTSSFEAVLVENVRVSSLNLIDGCVVFVDEASYSWVRGSFYLDVRNTGKYDCWIDTEISVNFEDRKIMFGTEGSEKISGGKSKTILVPRPMSLPNFEQEILAEVSIYSGERENRLQLVSRQTYPVKVFSFSLTAIVLFVLSVLTFVIILILISCIIRRRNSPTRIRTAVSGAKGLHP